MRKIKSMILVPKINILHLELTKYLHLVNI